MRLRTAFLSILFICTSISAQAQQLTLKPIISNLPPSWAVVLSPTQDIYVSHRAGHIGTYTSTGKPIRNYALNLSDLYYQGQGGLLDIAFSPNYNETPWVYLSYTFGNDDQNGLKIIRVMLDEAEGVTRQELVFTQSDLRDTAVHYGGRLAFLQDGSLLVTIGDGFDYREQAQVDSSQLGKILKISESQQVSTFSKGHRNAQGLIVRNNGQIISHEHGPDGGDEINIIEKDLNYGWPVITFGYDYIGGRISPFTEYPGMLQAGFDWTPSIAPSGMIYYDSERLPSLQNSLLVTSLKFKQLHSVGLTNNALGSPQTERIYFKESAYRMRDIAQSSDGRVFILGDGDNANVFEINAN